MSVRGLSEPVRGLAVMARAPVNTSPWAKVVVLLASIVPVLAMCVLMSRPGLILILSVLAFLVHALQIPAAVRAHAVILQPESRAVVRVSTAQGLVSHAQLC
jgi:hypothetical protein